MSHGAACSVRCLRAAPSEGHGPRSHPSRSCSSHAPSAFTRRSRACPDPRRWYSPNCPAGHAAWPPGEVARACSLSPASAAKAIDVLLADGLATETPTVLALGVARTVNLLRVNPLHPRRSALLPQLRQVVPPVVNRSTDRPPDRLRHAFWNVPPVTYRTLTVTKDGAFIATRALTTMDLELLGWAAASVPSDAWRRAAGTRGLPKAAQRMALNLAAAADA